MYVKDYHSFRKSLAFFMLSPCKAMYLFLFTMIMILFFGIIFSVFAPIDEVVNAKALLRPCGTISSVKVVSSGDIKSVNFFDGMEVQKGELLFELSTEVYEKERFSQIEEKQKQEKNLLAQNALYDVIATGKIDKNFYETDDLAAAYSYFYEKKMKDLQLEKALFEYKSEKAMPESFRVPYKIEQLRLSYETQKVENESWKQSQYAACIQNIKNAQTSIVTTENRIIELEKAIKESRFFAQIAGKVVIVHKLNEGDNVFSGEEILKIVPDGNEQLRAELYVSASDIAKIQEGNAVHINFPALPPSIYGFLETNIMLIPSDCTQNIETESIFTVITGDFTAILNKKRGKIAHLQSGMEATSRIITGKTTLFCLFLKKLDFIQ